MARAHFVKSARKDNPVAKKGESYYWWKPMVGGRGGAKRFSKERPTRSQLTQSEFLSNLYAIEDDTLAKATCPQDLRDAGEALRELGQEEQGKFDNMPDGLQQGDTGQMIEERAQNCETWADHLDETASSWEEQEGEREEAANAWAEFHQAEADYDEEDGGDEPEEPDSEEPDENWQAELAAEMIEEAQSGSPF